MPQNYAYYFAHFLKTIHQKGFLLFLGWFAYTSLVRAQNGNYEEIHLADILFNAITKKENQNLNKQTIIYDYNLNELLSKKLSEVGIHKESDSAKFIVPAVLNFDNCTFLANNTGITLNNINFQKRLQFRECTFYTKTNPNEIQPCDFSLVDCIFADKLEITQYTGRFLDIVSCRIGGKLKLQFRQLNKISIKNIEYHYVSNEDPTETDRKDAQGRTVFSENPIILIDNSYGKEACDLVITESKFRSRYNGCKFEIIGGFSSFEMNKNSISENLPLDLNGTRMDGKMEISENKLSYIALNECLMPDNPSNLIFTWEQLAGFKLCTFRNIDEPSGQILYQAQTQEELANWKDYEGLIKSYSILLMIYRGRGDIESANACYVESKKIKTRRLKYLFNQNPTLDSYLRYQVSEFLEYFCDYGTNPVKSVIYAAEVIFYFSIIYFFLPSRIDNLYTRRVMAKLSGLMQYFSENHTLAQRYKRRKMIAFQQLEQFDKQIRSSLNQAPAFLYFLAKPLYKTLFVYHQFNLWLLDKIAPTPGEWATLPKRKKWYIGSLVMGYFVYFLVIGLLTRLLNAIALSINAFMTLGYGEIVAKGIARYLAVAEGFIGWFLLSIFSASLISQLLQN
ncbi:MAG: potassium channel family protein [Microscillaceae bacterium]|nr:potassium channel family protein [Microscillaceae bacterium]MDW8459850.1 ion channel [Cytophagales bacterium]